MTQLLLQISFYLLVVATLLAFYRLAKGPTVVDRILAFDAVVVCAVGQVVLLSRIWESPLYLDLILIISSLGFLGTVALVFYLQRTMPTGDAEKEDVHE
ncbi:MAG TPA: monovalent cation/H+ antiporter complex subunit F [Opitutaceae bacterium]|jgi:multisubunit Na+/H+ antiporter MnhF subunit|nr:sodium:proton antiporter [Opitutaceae bacterium]HRE08364.1 monovalent cation/H+ antiporter complex subunit F [Opitutaceae bacterium]